LLGTVKERHKQNVIKDIKITLIILANNPSIQRQRPSHPVMLPQNRNLNTADEREYFGEQLYCSIEKIAKE